MDASHRDMIRITGPDRLSWLHSLTTQHAEQPGAWRQRRGADPEPAGSRGALPEPGRRRRGDLGFTSNPAGRAALLEFLTSMRFMLRVEPEDVSPREYAVLDPLGPAGGR